MIGKNMKTILYTLLLVILSTGCSQKTPLVHSAPQWYEKRELTQKQTYSLIGYGQGATLKMAKANAKEEIAQTLMSKVESSITQYSSGVQTTTKDEYKNKTESRLKIVSNLSLHNLVSLKKEQYGDDYFVALKYDNLDLAHRMNKTIQDLECKNVLKPDYLSLSPLYKNVTNSLGCKLELHLDRRNKAWYLKHKEYLFLLSEDEFEELFFSKKNEHFTFNSNKNVYYDGDDLFFNIQVKEQGYITLLTVYETGVVTLLQDSKPIKKEMRVPSSESENTFVTGTLKKGENTYDLYVALYSKKPLSMSRFEYADDSLASRELDYKFDELLELLNNQEYATILLRTKK